MGCRPRSTCPPGASHACLPIGDRSVHFDPAVSGPAPGGTASADRRRWRRLASGRQALLVLAYLRCEDIYAQLAAGFGVGIATVYRYIRETLDVLGTLAPSLQHDGHLRRQGVRDLDGTLLPTEDEVRAGPDIGGGRRSGAGCGGQRPQAVAATTCAGGSRAVNPGDHIGSRGEAGRN